MAYWTASSDTSNAHMVSAEEIGADASAAFRSIRSNNIYLLQKTPPTFTQSNLGARKRKHSKAKAAISSSNFDLAQMQVHEMSDSDLEKKRNKLGYQRISIACAHCRRRKIRCLVDENDPQQRCHNCIRLKKECVFYPVDQQNAMEEASQASSKAGKSSTVASSPAEIGSGRSFDEVVGTREFPRLSSTASSYPTEHSRWSSLSVHNQASVNESNPDYQPHSQTSSPAIPSTELNPSVQAVQPSSMGYTNQQHWQLDQFGYTGDFAPFPIDAAQQHGSSENAPPVIYASPNDQSWPPSAGSATFDHSATYMTSIDRGLGYHPYISQGEPLSSLQMHSNTTVEGEEDAYSGEYGYHRPPFWNPSHTYNLSSVVPASNSTDWFSNLASSGPQHHGQVEPVFDEPNEYHEEPR